ncbi:MAG: ImmA/IrrE family metallo-endopeptidase [Ignavibacteriaceae bacterium]|jgi:Zn-dependent peptidase ImmA (M78 family)|nr:ImmA/IrrE family metallo-endopeptidase [Ignavibacteriaceae bacterium]
MSEPEKKAVELIEKYCIDSPAQLNLEEIANAESLIVEEIDTNAYLGKINFNEHYGLVSISRSIAEPGAKRFTLAHELGHFINERDKRFVKHSCSFIDIYGKKVHENNANIFAAELLMYRPWFNKLILNRPVNTDLIKETAEQLGVSLTAAAFRYAEIGQHPVAVIMSRDGKVDWSYINKYFPYKWIPKGYIVRKESSAYDFFTALKKSQPITDIQTCDDLVPAHTWFSEDHKCPKDVYLKEQNVVMRNYKSVLTLLWQ